MRILALSALLALVAGPAQAGVVIKTKLATDATYGNSGTLRMSAAQGSASVVLGGVTGSTSSFNSFSQEKLRWTVNTKLSRYQTTFLISCGDTARPFCNADPAIHDPSIGFLIIEGQSDADIPAVSSLAAQLERCLLSFKFDIYNDVIVSSSNLMVNCGAAPR